MHFLISHSNRSYMQFMWEGKKYKCIGLPFGLALALRLATKMMAPVIRYLQLYSLRIAIYLKDLILLCRSDKESIV